jgi:hypothetical protein
MDTVLSNRNNLSEDVIDSLHHFTRNREFENKYGYTKGNCVTSYDYVCYYYFSEADDDVLAMWMVAPYKFGWSFAEQNLYFEYMFDKKLSPWRQLLPHLDLDIIRDQEDDTIIGLINYTTDINKFLLFHFLKNLRQIIERNEGIKLFTDVAKELGYTGEGEYSEEVANKLQEAFCIAHMFNGDGDKLYLDWGIEHKIFHGFPVTAMYEREMWNLHNLQRSTYMEDSEFTESYELNNYAFGQYEEGGDSSDDFKEFNKTIEELLNCSKPIYGHIFTEPTSYATPMFEFDKIKSIIPDIVRAINERNLG